MSATTIEPGKYLTLEDAQDGLLEAYHANEKGFDFVTALVEQFDHLEWKDFTRWCAKVGLRKISDLKRYASDLETE